MTDVEAWVLRQQIEAEAAALLAENPSTDDPRAVDLAKRIEAAKAEIGKTRWNRQTHRLVHGAT